MKRSLLRWVVAPLAGGALGLGVLLGMIVAFNRHLRGDLGQLQFGSGSGTGLIFILGGIAGGMSAAFASRRFRARIAALIAVSVFVLVVGGFLAIFPSPRTVVRAVVAGEPFASGRPRSYWVNLLAHPEEPGDRGRAARTLVEFARRDESLWPLVEQMLDDPEVFEAACQAFNEERAVPSRAVEALKARTLAAEAELHGLGDEDPTRRPKMVRADELVRALGHCRAHAPAVVPTLCYLYGVSRPLRSNAAYAINELMPRTDLPRSLASWRNEIPAETAAKRIRALGPDAFAEYLRGLTDAVRQNRARMAFDEIEALGGVGVEARGAVPALVEVCRDPNNPFDADAYAAAVALLHIDFDASVENFDLVMRRPQNWFITEQALRDVGEFGPRAKPLLPTLLFMWQHRNDKGTNLAQIELEKAINRIDPKALTAGTP
jgi:hypothetical protein